MFGEIGDKSIVTEELETLKFWKKNDILNKTIEWRKDNPHFVFFEGPPTANGKPGIHHCLSRIYKDTVCRYKTQMGFRVDRKAGWDTHGLPVELSVEKQLGLSGKDQIENYGIEAFINKCKDSVFTYEKDWFAPPLAEDVSLSYVEDKWAVEGPLYLSSSLSVSMDFAGVSLGLDIAHKTNYVATFDEICPNLIYGESYTYKVQTTSNSGSIDVTVGWRSWEPEPPVGCCYSKYFVTGQPEILLAKVTIKGTKGDEEVSTTLSGPFEVTYLDEDVLSADTTHVFAWSSEGSTPVDGITWEYGILSDDGIERVDDGLLINRMGNRLAHPKVLEDFHPVRADPILINAQVSDVNRRHLIHGDVGIGFGSR